MTRRVLSGVFVLVTLICCFPFTAIEAMATPQDHPNTHVNTGDMRADIIAVALTQVGYYEGAGNDTKYGAWYGWNYYGWCGAFVAWCANQAGVPTNIIAKTGVPNPTAFGLKQEAAGYIPKSGDLFFTKSYGHTGLVYYVEGEYFYTIEGNTWANGGKEGVYILKKKISDHYFASPAYRGGGSHTYNKEYEFEHPHKEVYKCSSCSDKYYSGVNSTRDDCIQCIQAACTHSYSNWSNQNDSNHIRICSKCEKQEIVAHKWNTGTVTIPATCSAAGIKTQACTTCGASKKTTIPKSNNHSYSAWNKVDEITHSRKCSVCSKVESEKHAGMDLYLADASKHWYECEVCVQQVALDVHKFGEACDSPCEICQYVSPSGHRYSENLTSNEEGHWYTCSGCDIQGEYGPHEFAAACDDLCDVCGYERNTEHSFSEEYTTDGISHWFTCEVCGKTSSKGDHISDEPPYEGAAVFCSVCDLQLSEEKHKNHVLNEVFFDNEKHWGSCVCGLEIADEYHIWSVKTGGCSVCGIAIPKAESDFMELLPWMICGCVLFFAMIGVLCVLIFKKRK